MSDSDEREARREKFRRIRAEIAAGRPAVAAMYSQMDDATKRAWLRQRNPEQIEAGRPAGAPAADPAREPAPVEVDPRVVEEFNAEAARLDAIEAEHGTRAVKAEMAGVPWQQARGFGPSFSPRPEGEQ